MICVCVSTNAMLHSIYLYDDHFTLIINASQKPLTIDNIPLSDIESAFEDNSEDCSSMMIPVPPKENTTQTGGVFFCFGGENYPLRSNMLKEEYHPISNSPHADAILWLKTQLNITYYE